MDRIISIVAIATIYLTLCVFISKAQSNKAQIPNGAHFAITYAGLPGGNISKTKFLADSILRISDQNDRSSSAYKIISFKMTLIIKGKNPILDIPSNGDKVPLKVRNLIKEAKSGDRIFFDDLRIEPQGGAIHAVKPPNFTLTDD